MLESFRRTICFLAFSFYAAIERRTLTDFHFSCIFALNGLQLVGLSPIKLLLFLFLKELATEAKLCGMNKQHNGRKGETPSPSYFICNTRPLTLMTSPLLTKKQVLFLSVTGLERLHQAASYANTAFFVLFYPSFL